MNSEMLKNVHNFCLHKLWPWFANLACKDLAFILFMYQSSETIVQFVVIEMWFCGLIKQSRLSPLWKCSYIDCSNLFIFKVAEVMLTCHIVDSYDCIVYIYVLLLLYHYFISSSYYCCLWHTVDMFTSGLCLLHVHALLDRNISVSLHSSHVFTEYTLKDAPN